MISKETQVESALALGPEIMLVNNFVGSLAPSGRAALFACLAESGNTIVATGTHPSLLEIADVVYWVSNGRCEEPEPIDRFLFSHKAASLISQGQLELALQARGAMLQAERWAHRNGIPIEGFMIELFGNGVRAAAELRGAAAALRHAIRDADLVLLAGRRRLICVFFDAIHGAESGELERRLVTAMAAHLADRGAHDVHFSITPDWKLGAERESAAKSAA
jgi:hypothetical protein